MNDKHNKQKSPPKWALSFLNWYCSERFLEEIQGDLHERFHKMVDEKGLHIARRWYAVQVFRFLRPFRIKKLEEFDLPNFYPAMIKNYFKLSFRKLLRDKTYSLINIGGLSIGIGCFILISIYVQHQLSYDAYHEQAENIYRIEHNDWAAIPRATGPFLKESFPAIKEIVSFIKAPSIIKSGDRQYREEDGFLADSTVFDIFSYEFIYGDSQTALTSPKNIILTQSLAQKYFGDEDPIGKTLSIEFWGYNDFQVVGVIKDLPEQSHFRFQFLLPAHAFNLGIKDKEGNWRWGSHTTYVYALLQNGADYLAVQDELTKHMREHVLADDPNKDLHEFPLRPLRDIYLTSKAEKEIAPMSSKSYIYIFSTVGLLILIIAYINFMNMATARSMRHAKEVGLTKVLGAHKFQLVLRFLGEFLMLSLFALLLAFMGVKLVYPYFQEFTGLEMAISYLSFIPLLLGITIIISILSGAYPAFYLSRFQPAQVLKVSKIGYSKKSAATFLRRGLIVFQFAISMILLIASWVINDQLDFVQNKNLGLNKDQVVSLPISYEVEQNLAVLEEELLTHASIKYVASSSDVPGERIMIEYIEVEGVEKNDDNWVRLLLADVDFANTYGLELVEGRLPSKDFGMDNQNAWLLNETAVKRFGLTDPIGKQIKKYGRDGIVVGVVKDFHFASLHTEIEPLAIMTTPTDWHGIVSIQFGSAQTTEALSALQASWEKIFPGLELAYKFTDDTFAELYAAENRLQSIVSLFTKLGIVIACLGLFSLTAFAVSQRTKEIGIRKVLGASPLQVVLLLSKHFFLLIVIAFILAIPISLWLMKGWLESFAYQTSLSAWHFALAGLAVLVIAAIAISAQALKAAMLNPVDTLRYE